MIGSDCYRDSKLTQPQGRILPPGLQVWYCWGGGPLLRRNRRFTLLRSHWASLVRCVVLTHQRQRPRGACQRMLFPIPREW